MKKKILFYLLPLLGLTLTGCGPKEEEPPKPDDPGQKEEVKATSIEKVETAAWIEQNEVLSPSEVSIQVKYSDGSKKNKTPSSVVLDTSAIADGVEGTVTFGSLSATFSINVVGQYDRVTINTLEYGENLDGYESWKEVEINGLLYDFMGVEETSPIKIKQTEYAAGYVYKGMVYNRSMINGFKSIKVNYSGSPLYITFSHYLMEDMSFVEDNTHKLPSDFEVKLPVAGVGYFVLYTSGTVTINSIDVKTDDVHDLDETLIWDENTKMNSARSNPKGYSSDNKPSPAHDLINVENKTDFNCYSTGTYGGMPKAWYRWCGYDMPSAELEGNEYSVHTTIIGNISNVIDPSKKFNYSVWPQFRQPSTSQYVNDAGWAYAYLGDDNYDPEGVKSDAHSDYCYSGRFFTRYDEELFDQDLCEFADPDTHYTLEEGSTTTLRAAYEAFKLPFWHVEFKVKDGVYRSYINGFCVDQCDLFYDNDYYPEENLNINRLELHLVNYGATDGTPAESYKGTFTTPRVEYYK